MEIKISTFTSYLTYKWTSNKKKGSWTEATQQRQPFSITYYSVVSCDSICIGFLLSSLHGIYVTDIALDNSYMNALCAENICFIGGDECGEDKVHVLPIVRALYSIKYTSFSRRLALAAALW